MKLFRGRGKTVLVDLRTFDSDTAENRGRSQRRDAPKIRKARNVVASPCEYPACHNRDRDLRSKSRLENVTRERGVGGH